jgi:predicted nuclease with RNAse H fold
MRILGINLNANEELSSGVAQLEDGKIRTFSVYNDKDIYEIIERFSPDLLVINAPLHMSENPYRSAEKEMVVMGYNPDPQNMGNRKELTRRAVSLRVEYQQNFEIIECHVESTKKALGIDDVSKLKGVRMLNIVKNIGEKDAIFAAVTGFFYKSGQFTEFGDDEEGKIIIPKLE